MKIHSILTSLRETKSNEKVASAGHAPPAPATNADTTPAVSLKTALANALATEKTASVSASSPVADVAKIAAEIRGAEEEAGVKRASLLGKAWAQAAIAEFDSWKKTASAVSAQPTYYAEHAEAPAVRGYSEMKTALDKTAEAEYIQGYNDTVNKIHAATTNEFIKGAAVVGWILDNQPQGK